MKLFNSLRVRLLLVMVVVTTLGIMVTAGIATRLSTDQFQKYNTRHNDRRPAPFVRILVDNYQENQGWGNVQPLIENLGQMTGERVILIDQGEWIVADSERRITEKIPAQGFTDNYFQVVVDGRVRGKLYIDPFNLRFNEDQNMLFNLNRSVLIGTVLVTLASILVTFFFSRSIIRPLEELTSAAQKMEKGDLSVRVRAKTSDEVGRLGHAFNAMASSIARLEQLRRNMVSDVAHELRTPLTNVRGYLEAVRDGLLKPDKALIDNLYEETMLLNRLVDDLQDLALAEAGRLKLVIQDESVEELVQSALALSQPLAQSRQISFETKIAPELPLLRIDEQRMLQVLRILINNAVDYSPEGGKIELAAWREGPQVLISIADQGPGIDQDKLQMVFERFYRADPSRTRQSGGAGLGLAIARQFVELHGGKIWAESPPGRGAIFKLAFDA
jgi:signal transduction histidine kinase